MQIYFAPMEGVTKFVYRKAHHKYFGGVDKYFTPFIAANQSGKFRHRDLLDLLPENNEGIVTVPQILTNNATDFIETSKALKELGYQEINLNLGCPSGTVVTKRKGSGFLAYPEELECFLDQIFSAGVTDISIKTRLGMEDASGFSELVKLYNKFPMSELIIHPRTQKDFYKNTPNMEAFAYAIEHSQHKLCYNGDLFTVTDFNDFKTEYGMVEQVMLGRGLIANPALGARIKGETMPDRSVFKAFHKEVYEGYQELLDGDRNVLFKMKEFWFYMIHLFENSDKDMKKIRKAVKLCDYEAAVNELFSTKEIKENAGFIPKK